MNCTEPGREIPPRAFLNEEETLDTLANNAKLLNRPVSVCGINTKDGEIHLKVTIKDVAKRAGVTPAAVSRIMNGDRDFTVRDETRRRVLQAIKDLDYHPNAIARSLKSKKTNTIAVVIPDITALFYPAIIKGVQVAARENGFSVILCSTDEDPDIELEYLKLLAEKQTDGIILVSAYSQDPIVAKAMEWDVPCVLVNRSADNGNHLFVGADDCYGAQLATNHLITLGHRKVAHISGLMYTNTGVERLRGYRLALNEHKLPFRSEYVVEATYDEKGGYNAMCRLLELPDPPTAVFTANDDIAMGAMEAIGQYGKKIPDALSLIGFNDLWISKKLSPPLSSVHVPLYDMGYVAATRLIDQIFGKDDGERRILFKPELMVRASVKPYKG